MRSLNACLLSSVLLLASVGSAAPSAAAEPAARAVTLNGLLKAFSGMPGLEAKFVEEKHLSLLAQPLKSEGRLFFTRPGLLLRRVETPRRSEVVITPEALVLRDADGKQNIDLRERPDIRPFVESLVWILAGDEQKLAKVFALKFEPARADAPWKMTLTPRAAPLDKLITSIEITGSGLRVQQIRVRETSGDETVTRILEANPARTFDAGERKRLFGTKS